MKTILNQRSSLKKISIFENNILIVVKQILNLYFVKMKYIISFALLLIYYKCNCSFHIMTIYNLFSNLNFLIENKF